MLISDEYRKMNAQLHEEKRHYGAGGHLWGQEVMLLIRSLQTVSVLDYGCGKQTLRKCIHGVKVQGYDPAVPSVEEMPKPHHLVVCTDVLEHIEPDNLDDVLAHIASVTIRVAFLVIATRPAKKKLPDGRNAHLIIENKDWWRVKLKQYFDFMDWEAEDGDMVVYALPKRG